MTKATAAQRTNHTNWIIFTQQQKAVATGKWGFCRTCLSVHAPRRRRLWPGVGTCLPSMEHWTTTAAAASMGLEVLCRHTMHRTGHVPIVFVSFAPHHCNCSLHSIAGCCVIFCSPLAFSLPIAIIPLARQPVVPHSRTQSISIYYLRYGESLQGGEGPEGCRRARYGFSCPCFRPGRDSSPPVSPYPREQPHHNSQLESGLCRGGGWLGIWFRQRKNQIIA